MAWAGQIRVLVGATLKHKCCLHDGCGIDSYKRRPVGKTVTQIDPVSHVCVRGALYAQLLSLFRVQPQAKILILPLCVSVFFAANVQTLGASRHIMYMRSEHIPQFVTCTPEVRGEG